APEGGAALALPAPGDARLLRAAALGRPPALPGRPDPGRGRSAGAERDPPGGLRPAGQRGARRRADWESRTLDLSGQRDRLLGRNPALLSGLVLSGANADPEAGLLTAEEVSHLDLRGCALVVLSACDTGLGKAAGGEGVLGLQRAFQNAGARATL